MTGSGQRRAALPLAGVEHRRPQARTNQRRWWTPALAAPALIITAPLIGFSFQGAERRSIYWAANTFASDPLGVVSEAARSVGPYVARGSFRPVGRIFENVANVFVFEAAEAAGIAPHVVNGGVRLAMIAILALTAAALVSAVMRSASAESFAPPGLVMFGLVLGTVLVANGADSPVIGFPLVSIGAVVFVLFLALLVARDRDMQSRPLLWHETVPLVLLGAIAAMTHELVYVAPPLAAGFIVVRAAAAGLKPKLVLQTAALRRWSALSAGFLIVFVPARVAIADRCGHLACSSGSDVSFSGDVAGLTAGRVLTGAPPAGWAHNAELVRQSGLEFGARDLAVNSLLALLVVMIVAASTRDGVLAVRHAVAVVDRPVSRLRPAACIGALGALAATLPALLVSLSTHIQSTRPPVGEAWRDTLMVQVGWSFLIAAAVMAIAGAASSELMSRVALAALATALCAGLAVSLLANERLIHVDRNTPMASIANLISESTVIVEPVAESTEVAEANDRANARRCGLVDAYTEMMPDPREWAGGPRLREELDTLMRDRYGWPFCDPARLATAAP